MLGILANRNIAVVPPAPPTGGLQPQADAVHLFSEAGRLGLRRPRLYLADPDFVPPLDVRRAARRDYLSAARAR